MGRGNFLEQKRSGLVIWDSERGWLPGIRAMWRKVEMKPELRPQDYSHCYYCGNELVKGSDDPCKMLTLDHVPPRAYGGKKKVPCCYLCNQKLAREMEQDWQVHGKFSQFCINKWAPDFYEKEKVVCSK